MQGGRSREGGREAGRRKGKLATSSPSKEGMGQHRVHMRREWPAPRSHARLHDCTRAEVGGGSGAGEAQGAAGHDPLPQASRQHRPSRRARGMRAHTPARPPAHSHTRAHTGACTRTRLHAHARAQARRLTHIHDFRLLVLHARSDITGSRTPRVCARVCMCVCACVGMWHVSM